MNEGHLFCILYNCLDQSRYQKTYLSFKVDRTLYDHISKLKHAKSVFINYDSILTKNPVSIYYDVLGHTLAFHLSDKCEIFENRDAYSEHNCECILELFKGVRCD